MTNILFIKQYVAKAWSCLHHNTLVLVAFMKSINHKPLT